MFYRSFYEAIKELPRDIQGEVYTAIMEYGLNGITTENLKPLARSIFTLIKPILDFGNRQYENGLKGGAPKGNSNAKKQPKNNPKTTQKQPKNNPNKEREKELELEGEIFAPEPQVKFAPLNSVDVAFADFYKKKFRTEYIWQENTSEAVARIAQCIADKMAEQGSETVNMAEQLTAFLEAAYRLGDSWLNQRFTPQLLAKQFNQLYQRIKNAQDGKNNSNATGVSADYLARIASELAGDIH